MSASMHGSGSPRPLRPGADRRRADLAVGRTLGPGRGPPPPWRRRARRRLRDLGGQHRRSAVLLARRDRYPRKAGLPTWNWGPAEGGGPLRTVTQVTEVVGVEGCRTFETYAPASEVDDRGLDTAPVSNGTAPRCTGRCNCAASDPGQPGWAPTTPLHPVRSEFSTSRSRTARVPMSGTVPNRLLGEGEIR